MSTPDTIGSYRVLSKLGEGGMGIVYEAEQQHPRRRVALKVVRGGEFVDENRVKMLQREANALARLKHPNIAAIYESGRTEDGQHFFAMELVRGETLDAYLDSRSASITPRELEHRLQMFRRIADAVHYAHQRGVIHRDLKPDNIVVMEPPGDGDGRRGALPLPQTKILDFGLARIVEEDTAPATTTQVGVIKGTLAYMSPEQARGNPEEIDVRTDVYTLGVILYEMLVGTRPYATGQTEVIDALQAICQEQPQPLRQSWSGVRRLHGDLETIVGKALEKTADRRYASAAALAGDVGRYLAKLPILARPPSTVYQLRKLVSRNMLPAALVGSFLLFLVGFGVWMSVLYRQSEANLQRARIAEAETKREARKALATNRFLDGMLSSADPARAQGREITVREILDDAAETVEESFANQPEVEASVRMTIGSTYDALGEFDAAEPQLVRSLQIRRVVLGEDHVDTAASVNKMAVLYFHQGRYQEAERLWLRELEIYRRTLGDANPTTLTALHNLGAVYYGQQRLQEAEAVFADALAGRRGVLGAEDQHTIASMSNLAVVYGEQGRFAEAEPLLKQVLDHRRRTLGENHPRTLNSTYNLGENYERQQRYDEADRFYAAAFEGFARVNGQDHPHTLEALKVRADLLVETGRPAEAEPLALDAYDRHAARYGPEHEKTEDTVRLLIKLYDALGDREQATSWRSRLPATPESPPPLADGGGES